MPFWSSQRVEAEQKAHLLITPFKPDQVKRGAYELSLSREVLATPDGSTSVQNDQAIKIPSGQFALLYTDEVVSIPANVIAFISLKGTVKFKGLINISGFQVDPGFRGRLKFSVYNAGSVDVHLNFGEPCFLIWFAEMDKATKDPYDGHYINQKGISAEDRDRMSSPNLSPVALSRRVDELEEKRIGSLEFRLNVFIGITAVIMASIVLPLFVGVAQPLFNSFFERSPKNAVSGPPPATNGIASNSPLQAQTNANVAPKAATAP